MPVERNLGPTLSQVRSVVSRLLGTDVDVYKLDREGGDSVVFNVLSDNDKYLLRTGGMRSNYDLEHQVLKMVRKRGVKSPEPIFANIDLTEYQFTFSLQRQVPGVDLNQVPESSWPSVLIEVGENLARMHEIQVEGFGELDTDIFRKTGQLVGTERTWYDYFDNSFTKVMFQVEEKIKEEIKNDFTKSGLTKEQQEKVLEIMRRTDEVEEKLSAKKSLLESVEPKLIHHDISFIHIFVQDGKLSAIIDFNHTSSGHDLFDIAYFSVMSHGEMYPHLLKGTGMDMDEELFNLYRLLISVGKLHTRLVRHNYLHKHDEILNVALEELNK